MVTPATMVALMPMDAPASTRVGTSTQSASVCSSPFGASARGNKSLVNITPWPTKTPSSMVTPSQMNEWLEILQARPITAPRWISTNAPTRDPSPIVQPYRLTSCGWRMATSSPRTTSEAIIEGLPSYPGPPEGGHHRHGPPEGGHHRPHPPDG